MLIGIKIIIGIKMKKKAEFGHNGHLKNYVDPKKFCVNLGI